MTGGQQCPLSFYTLSFLTDGTDKSHSLFFHLVWLKFSSLIDAWIPVDRYCAAGCAFVLAAKTDSQESILCGDAVDFLRVDLVLICD